MSAQFLPVEPFDLVVFGGTGDLAMRKLMPGLFHRDCDGQLPPESRIVGAARSDLDAESYRRRVADGLAEFLAKDAQDPAEVERFLARIHYVRLDAEVGDGWTDLVRLLSDAPERVRVFYYATASALFGPLSEGLQRHGLVTAATRTVLEKPLGTDLETARAINATVGEVFTEDQLFRIDHYLGKETVQNLITLRFGNVLFEPIWSSAAVDHVQITVAETVGAGDRVGYYDKSGALRDMVQNHILQLLCLVAMEPPSALNADGVRDEKLKVLRALRPIDAATIATHTVRGQYRAGAIGGTAVQGYGDELGDESTTETFVALQCAIDNWRWAGVPFYLRTGKRLPLRTSEVIVQFKGVPHSIFTEAADELEANRRVLRLQPDEGVKLYLTIKDPGPGGLRLRRAPLNLSYAQTFDVRYPDAYERLLLDVVRGNQTLFMREDEVDAAWRWIDPILQAWAEKKQPARAYTAGSWGPSDATALMARAGRAWHEDSL